MAVDLSHLPRSIDRVPTKHPDAPEFTKRLLDVWFMDRLEREQRPTVLPGQPWRPSKAAACSLEIWYHANGVEETNPADMAGHWSFEMGQMVHDWFDRWMPVAYPGIELEKQYVLPDRYDFKVGGNADAYLPEDWKGRSVAFELKSINGMGFKRASQGAHPDGPRDSALIQGSLAGVGLDTDLVVIMNQALEVTSQGVAKQKNIQHIEQRFAVEWILERDQYEAIAEAEISRVKLAIGSKEPAPRRPFGIPAMAEITNPKTGHWAELADDGTLCNTGSSWRCGYCNYQDQCIADKNALDAA